MTELYRRLYAPIQATVIRALLAHGAGRALANRRALVQEYVQHVFMSLFVPRPERIRDWDPDRSALRTWVRLHSFARVRDLLRARKRDPWASDAVPPEHLELHRAEASHEERVAVAELLLVARQRFLEGQSELGQRMFGFLFDEDLTTDEIRRCTKLSEDAVYKWRQRLRTGLRNELSALMAEGLEAPEAAEIAKNGHLGSRSGVEG